MSRVLIVVFLAITACCVGVVVASTSSSSSSNRFPRPPFLQHVDREALQQALSIAQQRHNAAVQHALSNYPTDKNLGSVDQERLDQIQQLQEYAIDAPGQLPDFADRLPRAVYVTDPVPLLTPAECQEAIQLAEDYFQRTNNGEWTLQQSGPHEIAGFWIRDIPEVHAWFIKQCQTRLFPLLARHFPDFVGPEGASQLCVDNAYLFKYTPETGRRTAVHTDSGCLSFTIALNGPDEYTGGGTWFEGLQSASDNDAVTDGVLKMKVGQVTIRPGGVKHAGHAVDSGTRYIIGGFCMHKTQVEPVRMLLTPAADDTNQSKKQALEAAIALNPGCDSAYNMLANHYEQVDNNPALAEQVLEYCLQNVHASSAEVAYALGSLAMAKNDHAKVMECMKICLNVDAADVDAMVMGASAAVGLGDMAQEQAMNERIVATPGASDAALGQAYCNLGVLQGDKGGDMEIEYYKKSLEKVPTRFAPRYSLASAYANREHWKLACHHFKLAVENGDGDVDHERQALTGLYKAAGFLIRDDKTTPMPSTQQGILERFQQIMGLQNYERLLVLSKGRSG